MDLAVLAFTFQFRRFWQFWQFWQSLFAFPISRLPNYPITQSLFLMSRDVGDLGDPTPLSFRALAERRDGERGTPRMFAATMQRQGILSMIPFVLLRVLCG